MIPRYPDKQQVIEYLDSYQKEFCIDPYFNIETISVLKEGDFWITKTTRDTFISKYLIMRIEINVQPGFL